jgi:hypothetical protein
MYYFRGFGALALMSVPIAYGFFGCFPYEVSPPPLAQRHLRSFELCTVVQAFARAVWADALCRASNCTFSAICEATTYPCVRVHRVAAALNAARNSRTDALCTAGSHVWSTVRYRHAQTRGMEIVSYLAPYLLSASLATSIGTHSPVPLTRDIVPQSMRCV